MLSKFCIVIIGALFVQSTLGLRCQTGYQISSNLINKTKLTDTECSSERSYCQKYQGEIIIYKAYRINVAVGLCAEEATYKSDCTEEENGILVGGFASATGLSTSDVEYSTLLCRRAYCEKDNCNRKDVYDIIKANEAVSSITPIMTEIVSTRAVPTTTPLSTTNSTTTTTAAATTASTGAPIPTENSLGLVVIDDLFECMEGFEIANDVVTTRSWNTTLCDRSMQQKCIRGEGDVVVSSSLEISVVTAFCANPNQCEESCNALLKGALADLEASSVQFEIRSCQQSCCDTTNCNNQTVNQIESRSNPSPTSIMSTIQTSLQTTTVPSEAEDIIECSSGYAIRSEIWNTSASATTLCRKSLGHKCARAEGMVLISEVIEVNMVSTFCGQETDRNSDCDQIFAQNLIQVDPALTESNVLSCNRVYCDSPNCNNKTIVQIETENRQTPTAMSPLTMPTTSSSTASSTTASTTTTSTTSSTNRLQCTTGYQVESALLTEVTWQVTTCESPNPSCIRSEIVASAFNNTFDIRLQIATCVDRSVCMQSCSDLTRDVFFSTGTTSDSEIKNLDLDSIDLRVCEFVCCQGENCNNDSISNIRRKLNPFAPTTFPPVEIDVPEENLECYSGYTVDSDVVSYNTWNLVRCPSTARRCVRADGTATLYGIVTANITVGYCSNSSECESQVCSNLLGRIAMGVEDVEDLRFTSDEFQLNFCDSTCCATSRCNNQSVSSILATNRPARPTRRPVDVDGTPASPNDDLIPDTPINPNSQSKPNCPNSISNNCQPSSCAIDQDEDTLFLLSLVPRLRNLSPRIASEVRMRFLETIHQAQFGNLAIR